MIHRLYIQKNKFIEIICILNFFFVIRKKWGIPFPIPLRFSTPGINQRIFYLKINREHATAYSCIQHWINIASFMNGFIYFVCDNPSMKKKILTGEVFFYNTNFSFIKSERKQYCNELSNIVKDKGKNRKVKWIKIAQSMLTPFIHAAKNNFGIIYNIDADDILLATPAKSVAIALEKAEKIQEKEKIDLFNLDMFSSKTFGVHWSFGVVICQDSKKIMSSIFNYQDWITKPHNIEVNSFVPDLLEEIGFLNIDWFFTYLRNVGDLKLATFYIENATVIHMPDYPIFGDWAFIVKWHNNNAYLPINYLLYKEKEYLKYPIPKNCICIDIGISQDSYYKFFHTFFSCNGRKRLENLMLVYALKEGRISKEFFEKNYRVISKYIKPFEEFMK